MNRSPQKGPLIALFWRLYSLLGAISAGIGVVLLSSPDLVLSGAHAERGFVRVIGGVFLVFGISRIVNAILQIRRLSRS